MWLLIFSSVTLVVPGQPEEKEIPGVLQRGSGVGGRSPHPAWSRAGAETSARERGCCCLWALHSAGNWGSEISTEEVLACP